MTRQDELMGGTCLQPEVSPRPEWWRKGILLAQREELNPYYAHSPTHRVPPSPAAAVDESPTLLLWVTHETVRVAPESTTMSHAMPRDAAGGGVANGGGAAV